MVERRMAASRSEAQQLIGAGRVLVAGAVADKSSRLVARAEPLVIVAPRRFVSRGGEKLDAALDRFGVSVDGRTCLDAGASTGGFTDCLLKRGAARVWAVDVGHGQLATELRGDGRVVVVERCNLRHTTLESLGAEPFEVVVADLSFISLTVVAQNLAKDLSAPGADLVMLVKPQFEAGRVDAGRGRGVIRDPAIWRQAIIRVGTAFASQGAAIMGVMASPVVGPAGNVEFLLHAVAGAAPTGTSLEALADECIIGIGAGVTGTAGE
jgi:23S rRNA (cytidine1920-2'-O)/16S rRNA (cytidine1409-2'-O)-methyltransferase